MELRVKSKVLTTHQVHGNKFTDEAMEQLRQQLIGAIVYSDYSGPVNSAPREYTDSEREQLRTRGQARIGYVKGVEGAQIIIVLDADEMPGDVDEQAMITKLDVLAVSMRLEDGSIIETGVSKVLGVYLVEERPVAV